MNDYLCTNQELDIVSARVRDAVQSHPEIARDVQFLPIHVRRSTGEEIPGYSVMNVLPRIEAVNREKCFWLKEADDIDPETEKPRIYAIGRVAVYAKALSGCEVLRLMDFPSSIIFSQRLADIWTSNRFTGAKPSRLDATDDEVPKGFVSKRHRPARLL
ncbi:MAG: hypothetical protein R3C02_01225 [Planctomycetaceae bacterium]